VNIANRNLIETGQNKQQLFKTYMATQAIIDYLGFATSETSIKMPLSFTFGKESFAQMLKQSEVDVKVIEHSGKGGLNTYLQDLLQAAAIIRAVHWRQLDPKADLAKQIKKHISDAAKNADILNNVDFKKFVEEITPKNDDDGTNS
jgi:S-adenosylmethionine synthetase